MPEMTLWSRYQDGAEPVVIIPGRLTSKGRRSSEWLYQVGVTSPGIASQDSRTRVYHSAKSLLIDLTGHPAGRNWTLDRYFKLEESLKSLIRPEEPEEPLTIFEILRPENALSREALRGSGVHKVVEIISDTPRLGIDLTARGTEVAKLLFAGFGGKIFASGLDSEEVLQEVLKGILIRNRGPCAFDVRKSTFGHYVHMVASCVLSNLWRRHNRRKEKEQNGGTGRDSSSVDASDSIQAGDRAALISIDPLERHAAEDFQKFLRRKRGGGEERALAERILPLVQEGYGRGEIAEKVGEKKQDVSKALGYLREAAREWQRG